MDSLNDLAYRIRRHALEMTHRAKSSHLGGALSIADVLAVLYGRVLRVDPSNPGWPDRDRFVLSKGHACSALYAALAEVGFLPVEVLKTFYENGSTLPGHATHAYVPGVEVSTGSLGHGLLIATGMALAAKRDCASHRVFCLLSDGECNEGSTWEAILFAPQHRLDNLVVILDYNKIQALGYTKDVMDLDPLADKLRSFRWSVREVDGHSIEDLSGALLSIPFEQDKPSFLIAHTVKGKGVSFMENQLLWHYRSPQGNEYLAALTELERSK